jgi:hypothetical protein
VYDDYVSTSGPVDPVPPYIEFTDTARSGTTRIELALGTLNATWLQNHNDNQSLVTQTLRNLGGFDSIRQQQEELREETNRGAPVCLRQQINFLS